MVNLRIGFNSNRNSVNRDFQFPTRHEITRNSFRTGIGKRGLSLVHTNWNVRDVEKFSFETLIELNYNAGKHQSRLHAG